MIRKILSLSALFSLLALSGYAADKAGTDGTPMHGIAMWGDLKYPANFTHFDYTNPDAPKGGTEVRAAAGDFDSLNPFILKGVPAEDLNLLFDTLMESSKDEASSEYGLIAESIQLPSDRSYVIFKLRKEARFHDGSQVTPDDVVFTFNILKKHGSPTYRNYYRDILKAEVLPGNSVKFTFAANHNRELPIIIGQLPVISKAYYSTHDFEKSTIEPPLGSGPYKVEKVDPGKSISYVRDDHYWAKDLPVNKGRYNVDHIRDDYYRDETVAIEAFKAGKYDFRLENISKAWASAYNFPAVVEHRVIKEQIPHHIPSGMQGFVFNIRRSKFADRNVRKALNYAFDFEWENKNLFYSAYTRDNSYFTNSEFAATMMPSPEEAELLGIYKGKIPAEVLTTVYTNPVSDGTGSNRANLLIAQKLLADSGWILQNGQLTHGKNGEAMKIEFLLDEPVYERAIAPYIKNLQKLGINASIRLVDNAQYIKRVQAFDFDVILHTFAESLSPGNEQINYWGSRNANLEGSQNLIGINNTVVDSLVEKIVSAQTKPDLVTATRALDRVLLWNYFVVPNWFSQSFRIAYWNKFSRPAIIPAYDLGLDDWWIDPDKLAKLNEKK